MKCGKYWRNRRRTLAAWQRKAVDYDKFGAIQHDRAGLE
jgi:hypothetical protein